MFVAIRHNWSSSRGRWEIQPQEYSSLAEAKEELCHGMLECSEHCRGVEIKRVTYLPNEWLERQIDRHKHSIAYHTKMWKMLERKLLARRKK
jgi:hypothetical protein